jgi:hypothetical protein
MGDAAVNFVNDLKKITRLTPIEEAALIAGGIRSPAALLAVTASFPDIANRLPLDSAKLSYAAIHVLPQSLAGFLSFSQTTFAGGLLPKLKFGARHAEPARARIGNVVPSPAPATQAGLGPLAQLAAIDVDRPNWLVRNQDPRATCVSFASAGLREYVEFLAGQPESLDFSEQFLHWSIKRQPGEPWPNDEVTSLYYANQALQTDGICNCRFWSYQRIVIPNNPGQGGPGAPSAPALADAATRPLAGTYADTTQVNGRALAVYNLLAAQPRPVAILVSVFGDANTQLTTWETALAWQYGEILDPLPGLVNFGGHTVIVTGFRPDPAESTGGYFIVRNSYSTSWASVANAAPIGQLSSGRQGYGIISATYVDNYLEETLVL